MHRPQPIMLALALLASTARGPCVVPRVCCFLNTAPARKAAITATLKRQLYRLAIARELPNNFQDAVAEHHAPADPTGRTSTETPLCLGRARQQHANYVAALRHILPVLELPPLENQPDCCFVEDAVVAIDERAVVNRMGHLSRRGEVDSIKAILEQLGMDIVDMREKSNKATCDGGDVLFTGRHLFVGLSNRTNREGAQVLSNSFSHIEAIVVPRTMMQGGQVLHLKSAVTHMDECTLVAPTGSAGDQVIEAMRAEQLGYQTIRLPDVLACNLVSCNGKLLVQDTKCYESRQSLKNAAKQRHMEMIYVDTSELAKKDAALTCCSVLLMGH